MTRKEKMFYKLKFFDHFGTKLTGSGLSGLAFISAHIVSILRLARIRNIILSLYNAAECATVMRHNLSANLTKLFKKEAKTNPDDIIDDKTDNKSVLSLNSDIRENHLDSLMDKLLRGEETEFFTEPCEEAIEEKPVYTEWDINLRNCQVLLKGTMQGGMMILTAAESSWDRNEYKRTWRDGQYLDKFSWKGHLRGMQLFSRKSDILQAELGFQILNYLT